MTVDAAGGAWRMIIETLKAAASGTHATDLCWNVNGY
jgi:hypothetical protein